MFRFTILCLIASAADAKPARNLFQQNIMNRGGGDSGHRIVGGKPATQGEIPWQVSFQDTTYGLNYHFCGGTILNNRWIISAAHCVAGNNFDNPVNLQIMAGEHDRSITEGNEQALRVVKIVQHEKYNPNNYANDIALLQLEEPGLLFNKFVQPVSLPAQNQETAAGTNCLITGWGYTTQNGGYTTNILQKANILVISDADCSVQYARGGYEILPSMICAGMPDVGGIDSCQGDSGGPMVCNPGPSQYLCGIVSWGVGCALPDYPGVYTEVSYYINWILANTA